MAESRFARVLTLARQTAATSELPQLHTTAGFDYGISHVGRVQTQIGDAAWDHLQIALYLVANEGHDGDDFEDRDARRMALLEELTGEIARFVEQCQARRYTGWSNAARDRGHPIRYAN